MLEWFKNTNRVTRIRNLTDDTMGKRKRTKKKPLHRTPKIEEHKTHQKPGVKSGAPFLAILFPPVGFLAFKDFFFIIWLSNHFSCVPNTYYSRNASYASNCIYAFL